MAEGKRFERDPVEGSRSTVEKQLKDQKHAADEDQEKMRQGIKDDRRVQGSTEDHPMGSFPPFTDPAFSFDPDRAGPKKESPISAEGDALNQGNKKTVS